MRPIRIAGAERAAFLQSQLTQDMRLVTPARSALAAWATAQGRVLFVAQIVDWQEAYWLAVHAELAEAIVKRLRQFVLRAKVTVEMPEGAVFGVLGAGADALWSHEGLTLEPQPLLSRGATDWVAARVAGDVARVLIYATAGAAQRLTASLSTIPSAHESDWIAADIATGIPGPLTSGSSQEFIPQMLNLDLIGGVSFNKGCYPGQEIVTRTRHLGQLKRRLQRFRCDDDQPLSPGASVLNAVRAVGQVLTATPKDGGQELLAVVPIEDCGELFIDETRSRPLARLQLPYAIPER